MSKLFASLLIALIAMMASYATAATTASHMTSEFSTVESTSQSRTGEFAANLKRAEAAHRSARAKCELLTGEEKNGCNAEAKAEQRLARSAARNKYKEGVKSLGNVGLNEEGNPREVDVSLYRAHRQLPY